MRITNQQAQQIKQAVRQELGEKASVWLFGSRVDDNAKGGDIDLYVRTMEPIPSPALTAARLAAKVMRFHHGRKVDVVLQTPDSSDQPIYDIALNTGILL